MQQCVYETKICDIYDLQKCLTQTWVDSEQNVIEAAIDQWRDRLRSRVRVGGGNIEYLYFAITAAKSHTKTKIQQTNIHNTSSNAKKEKKKNTINKTVLLMTVEQHASMFLSCWEILYASFHTKMEHHAVPGSVWYHE